MLLCSVLYVSARKAACARKGLTQKGSSARITNVTAPMSDKNNNSVRRLATEIQRCPIVEAVLDGEDGPCCQVVGYQSKNRDNRWYVPEPWTGHIASARILFISSNPSAGEREEPFDPDRHMSRNDTDDDLFAAADGAFDVGPWPGIVDGIFNR